MKRINVLFYASEPRARLWADALRQEFPEASVREWIPNHPTSCDYAVCSKPPAAFFTDQPRLKAIFSIGAGVDTILRDLGTPRDVPIFRLEDAGMAAQMEEYVTCFALLFMRRLDEYRSQNLDGHWTQLSPRSRAMFPIGIMGLGVLGSRVARFLRDIGFPVLAWTRASKRIGGVKFFAGDAALSEFLRQVIMLVCMLPLTDATRGILNRANLSRLPRGAYVVNVARGDHLVAEDLVQLLDDGHLAAAALDVFPEEPLPSASSLWRHPRIWITPHVAAEALANESMRQIATKIRALELGGTVTGLVDRDRGY